MRKVPESKKSEAPTLVALLEKAEAFADEAKRNVDAESSAGKGKANAGEPSESEPPFKVGQAVVLHAKKEKDKFDNKKCEVKKVLSQKVTVEIKEGPAIGELKKVPFASVTLCAESQTATASEPKVPEERAANEKLASQLFGDVQEDM